MSGSNIKVACRFRPQNRVELENEGKVVIEIVDEQTCIIEVHYFIVITILYLFIFFIMTTLFFLKKTQILFCSI